MRRRATALTNSSIIDQLCDVVLSKLVERFKEQLPSKQWVAGSNPSRDASKARGATA